MKLRSRYTPPAVGSGLLFLGTVLVLLLPSRAWLWAQAPTGGAFVLADMMRYQQTVNGQLQACIDISIALDGASVSYLPTQRGTWQGQAEVALEIWQGAQIVHSQRIGLLTAELSDTAAIRRNHFSHWGRRLALPPGKYRLSITARDATDTAAPTQLAYVHEFVLDAPDVNAFQHSDVQFVRSIEPAPDSSQTLFVRHGHRVLPNLTGPTYYEADTLGFYLELYNLVKLTQQPYYAKVTLIPASGGKKSQAFQRVYKPRQPQELAVLNGWFDIRNLSSNTYILEVELLTNDNVLLSTIRRKFFVVSSVEPFEIAASEAEYDLIFGYPEEELTRYIQAMGYISTEGEETMVNALQTYDDKKKYFVGFWTKRAQAFDRPMQQVWEDYRLRIEYANDKFRSARLAGWRSPRGRIFLTYGPPDDLQDFQNEQNLFPYQIWTYNVLRGQGGVFFVFFDRDLVSGDFELLHSTLIGEVFNANWRARLMRTRNAPDDFSITAPQGNDPFAFPDDKTMPGIGTGVR